jgi:hypothetical protein
MSIRRLGRSRNMGMVALCVVNFILLTGCVGYVSPGGGGVYVAPPPPPSVVVWGGTFDSGRNVHVYRNRGFRSRAAAPRGGFRR